MSSKINRTIEVDTQKLRERFIREGHTNYLVTDEAEMDEVAEILDGIEAAAARFIEARRASEKVPTVRSLEAADDCTRHLRELFNDYTYYGTQHPGVVSVLWTDEGFECEWAGLWTLQDPRYAKLA